MQDLTAQTKILDSLKRILPSLKDTARINCLNELGAELSDRYWSKSKYQQTDTAYLYTAQALKESQQLNYIRGIRNAYQNLGYIEEEHSNMSTAEVYTRKALAIAGKGSNDAQYHRCQVFLGWILHNRGFFKQSIQLYKQELPYYKAIKDSVHIAAIIRMTARAYDALGNSEDAFAYFQQDFAIQKRVQDAWGKRSSAMLKAAVYLAAGDTANAAFYYKQAALASVDQRISREAYHTNMATAYNLQKQYDSAVLEIRNGNANIQSSKKDSLFSVVGLMINYNALSGLFVSLKKFDSAIVYARQSAAFFKQGDHIVFLMPALKTLATAYYAIHQHAAALNCTNQLLYYAKKSGARPFERDAYDLFRSIYLSQRKPAVANNYYLKYILLNDSLQNDKYISQASAWKAINDLNINEVNYKSQLKINEERNNARIERIDGEKKIQQYVFVAVFGLVSLFTLLIVRNSRLRRKRDQLQIMMTQANIELEKQKREQDVAQLQQQKTALEMQALRAQMNPHFIFNCLNSINRFTINNDAERAADYLTKFAKLIRIVLEQSGKSLVSLEDELKCLRLYMDLEALRFEKPFRYTIDLNVGDTSSVMIPTLLIQPFVENAIWHGLHPKQNSVGEINIKIHQHDDVLHCSICDNGVGLSSSNGTTSANKKSLGISITKKRLQLAKGNSEKIEIEIQPLRSGAGENSGTAVNIKIPFIYS